MIFMEIGSFIELQFSNGKEFYKCAISSVGRATDS